MSGFAAAQRERLEAADEALRKEQHDQQDDAAHHGPPEVGAAGDFVGAAR